MLKYLLFFVGVVVVFLVVRKIEEGFQTRTIVDLYFNVDTPLKGPTFIKSSDPRVKYVSSGNGGTVVLNVDPTLGQLQGFNGAGWSQANIWIPLAPTDPNTKLPLTGGKLDYSTSALYLKQPYGSGTRYLHNKVYNRNMLPTGAEVKLPQSVTNIILGGFDTSTFGLGANSGDMANENAKIKIMLYF